MKKQLIFLSILATITACNDYLDVQPKGVVIPKTIEDYDLLLNGNAYSIHSIDNAEILGFTGNDFEFSEELSLDTNNPDYQNFQLYSYGDLRFYNPSTTVPAWDKAYGNIYIYNKIINEVDAAQDAVGYKAQDKIRVKAEAQYFRALDYFYLVNTFAKHYSPKNADTPGVPLVREADITQKIGSRNTVGEVYEFILNNLEEAIPNLPNNKIGKARPDKAAGYALLARIYLYKSDFEKALNAANKALEIKGELADYVEAENISTAYESQQYSSRFFGGSSGTYTNPSKDLKSIIDTVNDTRYSKFFTFYPGYGVYSPFVFYHNQLPSVGEMYVTRAEANAHLGKNEEAIKDLNQLGEKRIINYQPLMASDFSNQSELLKYILNERRKEIYFTLTQVFDVKRRNLIPGLEQSITHEYGGVKYTATPNSGKLVLPIPASVLKFHPDWQQN